MNIERGETVTALYASIALHARSLSKTVGAHVYLYLRELVDPRLTPLWRRAGHRAARIAHCLGRRRAHSSVAYSRYGAAVRSEAGLCGGESN
jgi:hypothetical protein